MTEINTSVPHSARIWNYWLGGKDNYPADREAGDAVAALLPRIAESARHDRAFLGRVVRLLSGELGITQFLDIGTGLPTADNTHEVAQRTAARSRVVYVDNDPLVLAHARALLVDLTPEGVTDYIDADVRDTETVLEAAAGTLDFTRPVAVMLLGILNHVIDDDEAMEVVRRLMAAVPPGSCLAVSHPTEEVDGAAMRESMRQVMERGGTPIVARSPRQIAAFFEGMELLEPGVVPCSRWRPDPGPFRAPPEIYHYGALGRK